MSLAPLRQFGLSTALVSTMQAVSGAGYPGVPSLDILGNVVPFIGGEEEKMETETLKILGSDGGRVPHPAVISAHTNRVGVIDGHVMTVSAGFDGRPSVDDVIEALRRFRGRPQELGLPSAPDPPVVVMSGNDRPQPRLDVDRGDGMAVCVGRVRPCKVTHTKFVALGHNTVRGAAGAAILNAEMMAADGLFD
jgi:aspartate-semialdehyde dehydrogenase